MTFITLASTRVKIESIINYVALTKLEGASNVFTIDIWQATQFATAFVSVQYTSEAQRNTDLARLDAAVNSFVEPTPGLSLSGALTLHYLVNAFPSLFSVPQSPIAPVTITNQPPATS